MSSTADLAERLSRESSSPLTVLLNNKYKDTEVDKYHKEAYLYMAFPIVIGISQLLFRVKGHTKLANNLSLVNSLAIASCFIGIREAQNRLEKRLLYVDMKYPLPTQGQEELSKSLDMYKH